SLATAPVQDPVEAGRTGEPVPRSSSPTSARRRPGPELLPVPATSPLWPDPRRTARGRVAPTPAPRGRRSPSPVVLARRRERKRRHGRRPWELCPDPEGDGRGGPTGRPRPPRL